MQALARPGQPLSTHLTQTGEQCANFASVLGCKELGRLLGLVHDVGKYSKQFQRYLQRSVDGGETKRGEIRHAVYALLLLRRISADLNKGRYVTVFDLLSNVVASHHGHLMDMLIDGRLSSELRSSDCEWNVQMQISLDADRVMDHVNLDAIEKEIIALVKTKPTWHLLTKFLYSCLVDADRLNAATETPKEPIVWNRVQDSFNRYILSFRSESAIDRIRAEISRQCYEAANRDTGMYTLAVPTGGGKTLASLRFAIEHAKRNNLKRIVYVIPYLSILDQTAKLLREKVFEDLDESLILEHHSNFKIDENDLDEDKYRDLVNRWDGQIVLTTMVQFLESIYSNKASDLRKFHNMSESVIVFDEIQALPVKCYYLFNDAVNFLSRCARTSVVLCTATQPGLTHIEYPVVLSQHPSLVSLSEDKLKVFKRTRVVDKTERRLAAVEIASFAEDQRNGGKSVLVVMNTKSSAEKVYDACLNGKYLLTTSLCTIHRLAVMENIKNDLVAGRPIVVVSTQLIEAGVDVSFGCVIRASASWQSIVQAAGRCNRNGECPAGKDVFIVDVDDTDERLDRLPDIALMKSVCKKVMEGPEFAKCKDDLPCDLVLERYESNVLALKDMKDKMNCPVGSGGSVFEMLWKNRKQTIAYESLNNRPYRGVPSAFATAAESFSVIENKQISVVVPYRESDFRDSVVPSLVTEFKQARRSHDYARQRELLRKLQQYSVNVYVSRQKDIESVAENIEDVFFSVDERFYSEEKGLQLNSENNLIL